MDDQQLTTLEDQDKWDFEQAERRPGVKDTRSVVSVAFARSDYERVSRCAKRLNKRTSEFIRDAALGEVQRHQQAVRFLAFSGSLGASLFMDSPCASTRLVATTSTVPRDRVAITA